MAITRGTSGTTTKMLWGADEYLMLGIVLLVFGGLGGLAIMSLVQSLLGVLALVLVGMFGVPLFAIGCIAKGVEVGTRP